MKRGDKIVIIDGLHTGWTGIYLSKSKESNMCKVKLTGFFNPVVEEVPKEYVGNPSDYRKYNENK
jgi:hypothetical protein